MLPKDIFQKHTHIGLDLDETLASTFAGMLDVAHSMWKLKHCSDIESFVVHDIFDDPSFGISREETFDIWYQYGLRTLDPRDTHVEHGAIDWVRLLIQQKIECSIITARNGNDPIKKKRSEDWIDFHFPAIWKEKIHFVNHYSDEALPKSHACRDLGITLLIDDHVDNARDMIDAGLSMILLEKPWNRDIVFDHPNLYRVKNWQEIIDNLSSQ